MPMHGKGSTQVFETILIGLLCVACAPNPYEYNSVASFTAKQICPTLAVEGHGAPEHPLIRGYTGNRPVALHGRQALVETSDGGHVLLANTDPHSSGGDAMLMKITGKGEPEWANFFGGHRKELCDALVEATGGGYLVAGTSEVTVGKDRILLFKTDDQGTLEWHRDYALYEERENSEPGKPVYGQLHSIDRTSDGGYVVTGKSYGSSLKGRIRIGDVLVAKVDSQGSIEWIRSYGGAKRDAGNAVLQSADGGYIIVGFTNSFEGQEVLLIKLSSSGEVEWARTFGQPAGDYGFDIIQTTNGDFVVGGWTRPKSKGYSGDDILLSKVDQKVTSSGRGVWKPRSGANATLHGIITGCSFPSRREGSTRLLEISEAPLKRSRFFSGSLMIPCEPMDACSDETTLSSRVRPIFVSSTLWAPVI